MLEISNLNVCYGDLQVIWHLSLKINLGEIVALIGANGAGKTTVLRAICGLLPVSGGEIRFNNKVINNLAPHKIVEMGIVMVPEGRRIFPRMSVCSNLEMGAFTLRARKNRVTKMRQVLEMFPILGVRQKQMAGTLSGGEQQMLAIGRALMSDSRMILMDEMSLGLSPKIVAQIFEIIRDIHKTGIAVLVVEQNVSMTLAVANRAYILETGKIAMTGEAKAMMNNEHVSKAYMGI